MPRDTRKNPRAGDAIYYRENGAGQIKLVEVISVAGDLVRYRKDGEETSVGLAMWRRLARGWLLH